MGPPSLLLWFVRRARLFYGLSTGPRLPAGPPRLSTAPARRRPASARLPVVRPRPFLHPSLLSTACPPTRPPRLPAALACRPDCQFLQTCSPPQARKSHNPAQAPPRPEPHTSHTHTQHHRRTQPVRPSPPPVHRLPVPPTVRLRPCRPSSPFAPPPSSRRPPAVFSVGFPPP